mgnify:CR=1 FL=1
MSWASEDVEAMRTALALAAEAARDGEIPVGAVVVRGGHVLGRGRNRSVGDHDPSAHAEIAALRKAAKAAGNHRLPQATVYVTLEPCPMCFAALAQARVGRVVFGAYDEKAGAAGSAIDLSESRALNHRFEINGGLLADEAGQLLESFFEERR